MTVADAPPARPLPAETAPAYLDVMTRTAETRLTLAGYRLADIAEAIAGR